MGLNGVDRPNYTVKEAAEASGFAEKVLRSYLDRSTFHIGTKEKHPINRWLFSHVDLVRWRIVRGVLELGPMGPADAKVALDSAHSLRQHMLTAPATYRDLKQALIWEAGEGGYGTLLGDLSRANREWVFATVGEAARIVLVMPIGLWLEDVETKIAAIEKSREETAGVAS